MDTFLKTLTEFGISAVSITGLIAYLGKKIFEQYLTLKVDAYKNDLASKSSEFKNELERINIEHQIKFSKLHNDRTEVIKKIFTDFTELEKLINNVTNTWQGPEWLDSHEREDQAGEYLKETCSYFEKNKIYFSKELSDEIENALKVCKSFILESLRVKNQSNYERQDRAFYFEKEKEGKTAFSKWLNLESESQKELKKIRNSLAGKFRELFGVKK
ncbi:hypothetical protein [Marinifilum fragile]|uniref:hypothetical protein n=1 Tax=Marinifilum fragile TaxID=570161 RepID=UPI002AA6084B|nr:hypothetical protein [Marinifilum fragile]